MKCAACGGLGGELDCCGRYAECRYECGRMVACQACDGRGEIVVAIDGVNGVAECFREVPQVFQAMKVTEEAGEVAEAWIGMVGVNPRKGVTNGIEKVQHELLDVAMTALAAWVNVGGGPGWQGALEAHCLEAIRRHDEAIGKR